MTKAIIKIFGYVTLVLNVLFFVWCCILSINKWRKEKEKEKEQYQDYFAKKGERYLRMPWITYRSKEIDPNHGQIVIDRFFFRWGYSWSKKTIHAKWWKGRMIEKEFQNWSAGLSVGTPRHKTDRRPYITKKGKVKGGHYWIIWGILDETDDVNYTNNKEKAKEFANKYGWISNDKNEKKEIEIE